MQTGSRGHAAGRGELTIKTEALDDGVRVFELHGELDSRSSDRLHDELDEAIDRGAGRVLLDLSGLRFCDSSGLQVIVAAYHRLTMAGGRLSIVCDDDRILRVFRVTRLDRLLAVTRTRRDALERFESWASPRRWGRIGSRPSPA
jgi:anti-sigma B factor antagonist